MDIRIGLTKSDHLAGYSSFSDGYREGAEQVVIDVTVNAAQAAGAGAEEVAEAVFVATNSPFRVEGLAAAVREALLDVGPIRALSVGDTVETGGTRLAVARYGYRTL